MHEEWADMITKSPVADAVAVLQAEQPQPLQVRADDRRGSVSEPVAVAEVEVLQAARRRAHAERADARVRHALAAAQPQHLGS